MAKETAELYISVDVETTGLHPVTSSMINLGAAAFTLHGDEIPVSKIDLNLKERRHWLPAFMRPRMKSTMKWWKCFPAEWEYCTTNPYSIKTGMTIFVSWVRSVQIQLNQERPDLDYKVVFLAYPASFDFNFVQHYILTCGLDPIFNYNALDIKSYVMGKEALNLFSDSRKAKFPDRWKPDNLQPHIGVEDAIEQGVIFIRAHKENLNTRG